MPFLAPLENWPTSLQVSFQKGGCPFGGDTRTPTSQIKREGRPPRKLLQEPQETRGSVGSPDKPVPDILHNVVLDSEANLKVQKTQDLWSDAPNPARVEGQEEPSSYTFSISGHGPHYLLHNSTVFPADLLKPQFFCS